MIVTRVRIRFGYRIDLSKVLVRTIREISGIIEFRDAASRDA